MKYEVLTKSDFLTGTCLEVSIPEDETDQNALKTMQNDCPDFVLPFHYKNSNGQTEIIYKVGVLNKLQYLAGELSVKEYAEFWNSLIKPLIACSDWFMNPNSFILNTEYLYYDKNSKTISYVYIPSTHGVSGYEAFYEMASEVSKLMTVSDAVLENKVLRALMTDFNPLEFLQMLKNYVHESSDSVVKPQISIKQEQVKSFIEAVHNESPQKEPPQKEPLQSIESRSDALDLSDDIVINFKPDNKKDTVRKEVKKENKATGFKLFNNKNKKKKVSSVPVKEKPEEKVIKAPVSVAKAMPTNNHIEAIDEIQNTVLVSGITGFRYIGNSNLPPSILVHIPVGKMFTIGRFDAAVGKKQSSFEFEKKTKAVSRRHAVIEHNNNGYFITDLSSSAGTFVNDKKIPPNTQFKLETGCRVSFGNSGADYVWESA